MGMLLWPIKDLLSKKNIPPMASSTCQMSVTYSLLTEKIAKHRVHIERLIAKAKTLYSLRVFRYRCLKVFTKFGVYVVI